MNFAILERSKRSFLITFCLVTLLFLSRNQSMIHREQIDQGGSHHLVCFAWHCNLQTKWNQNVCTLFDFHLVFPLRHLDCTFSCLVSLVSRSLCFSWKCLKPPWDFPPAIFRPTLFSPHNLLHVAGAFCNLYAFMRVPLIKKLTFN